MGCNFSSGSTETSNATHIPQTQSPSSEVKMSKKEIGQSNFLNVKNMRDFLEAYMATEERIHAIELSNPIPVFYVKKSQLEQTDTKIKDRLEQIEKLKVNLCSNPSLKLIKDKEFWSSSLSRCGKKSTRVTVLDVLENIGDKKLSREEQDLLVATNQLEIATIELEMLYQERVVHGNRVAELHQMLSQLDDEYKNQDLILEQLGVEEYLSEDSAKQIELIDLESRRITISESCERWKEARMQLLEVCGQFSMVLANMAEIAVQRSEQSTVISCNGRGQFEIGEEIRDRLVSISQGLENAKFLIQKHLPYCSDAELEILRKAMEYLFIDLRTPERRTHASDCYSACHTRAVALLAWIDQTIEKVIEPALDATASQMEKKVQAVSKLRIANIFKQFPSLCDKKDSIQKKPTNEHLEKHVQNENMKISDTAWENLESVSKDILVNLNFKLLAKLPKESSLFDEEVSSNVPTTVQKGKTEGITMKNPKERTSRLTRKASMDNLTKMLVDIDSNLGKNRKSSIKIEL